MGADDMWYFLSAFCDRLLVQEDVHTRTYSEVSVNDVWYVFSPFCDRLFLDQLCCLRRSSRLPALVFGAEVERATKGRGNRHGPVPMLIRV
jgi:hypothetical protein